MKIRRLLILSIFLLVVLTAGYFYYAEQPPVQHSKMLVPDKGMLSQVHDGQGEPGKIADEQPPVQHYKMLIPGKTTLSQMYDRQGEPNKIAETKNGKNYIYDGYTVNFSGPRSSTINTITILNDVDYVTPTGIRVGDSREAVNKTLESNELYGQSSPALVDYDKSLYYWFWSDRNKVEMIVIGRIGRQ